jgi:predicted DNA-binding transcriptional regulator YafY
MERLIAIITVLQSRKFVTAEKIAEKYKISVRTVYRDIKALCESGIPIGFEAPKGYFIVQGYFLPPVSFTSEEANALLLMESLAKGFADRSIQKHYSSALSKVKAGLRSTQKDNVETLSDTIKLQLPDRLYQDHEYMSSIQTAISDKKILTIEYKNNKEERSKRDIEPIGLIFYAFGWHLIGWCHLRKEYRDFKVSRIVKLKCTEQSFKKDPHLPLAEYMKELPVNY